MCVSTRACVCVFEWCVLCVCLVCVCGVFVYMCVSVWCV